MPAVAAHYLLGQIVYENLEPKIKKLITDHKSLFDIGLQGPDILFFYKPLIKNRISTLGHNIHKEKAERFFVKALNKKAIKKEKLLVYLFGICCHYSLDRAFHPYVTGRSETETEHQAIEADFDYEIIKRYNLSIKRHIYIPVNVSFKAISRAYDDISKSEVKRAVHSMRRMIRFLEYRRIVTIAERLTNRKDLYSTLSINKRRTNPLGVQKMLLFFEQGVKDAHELIDELYKAYKNKSDNIKGFKENFIGVKP